jgi:hypothetical protein
VRHRGSLATTFTTISIAITIVLTVIALQVIVLIYLSPTSAYAETAAEAVQR